MKSELFCIFYIICLVNLRCSNGELVQTTNSKFFTDDARVQSTQVFNICTHFSNFSLSPCEEKLKRPFLSFHSSKTHLMGDHLFHSNVRHSIFKRHQTDTSSKNHFSKSASKHFNNISFTNDNENIEKLTSHKNQITFVKPQNLKAGNQFKLKIATIKLPKLRLRRKPTKAKNKLNTYVINTTAIDKLFQGVTPSKEKELNFLVSNDFQTGFMEFIEMAYNATKYNQDRKVIKMKVEEVDEHEEKHDSKMHECGYKFSWDLEKIINLNKIFSVQIDKAIAFVNLLNSILTNADLNQDSNLYDKILKSFLFSDKKFLAAGLIFEPSHAGNKENFNPYLVKTNDWVSILEKEQLLRDSDNDQSYYSNFKNVKLNKLTTKRQIITSYDRSDSGSYDKLPKDYSLKLQQYKNVCLSDKDGKAITTLRNEGLWGHLQSDCTIREAMSGGREQFSHHLKLKKKNNLTGVWTVLYFLPFFGCVAQNVSFKGVLKVVFDLTKLEFNQCENNNKTFLFNVQHNCPPTTQCQHISGGGLRRGNYKCVCMNLEPFSKEPENRTFDLFVKNNYDDGVNSFFHNATKINETFLNVDEINFENPDCSWTGKILEDCILDRILNRSKNIDFNEQANLNCSDCFKFVDAFGCPDVKKYEKLENENIWQIQQWTEEYSYWMKGLPFAIQCLSILAGLAILVVVAKLKKNKVMKVSIWILLEFSVVGALLIHVSVILDYFEATPVICLMIPWCREIGFVLLYGSLILKIQRTLTEFQSRKAHRVQWPDKDLIRCLIIMATILALHMAAWTASVCDNLSFAQLAEDIRIDIKKPFSSFSMLCRKCYFSIKDRILEGGELVFLGYSLYMCYKVRKAPNEYHENKFITFCILNELLTSALYYSIRYFAGSTWLPDQIFLASFIKCHLTVTLAIILVVCSKLWYSCWPPSAEYRTRSCSSAPSVDSRSVQFLNPSSPPPSSPPVQFEPTKSDSNNLDETDISQMTSEDIRYELRKLYTQLQIYKTKTMRLDNPHISRRRGGKKQPNRKFSFQNLHAKYRQQSSVTSTNAAATTPSGSVGGGTSMAGDHCENSTVTGGGEIDLSVRSPEDSSNSMEGVSVYMDENSYASPEINTSSGKDCYAAKKQQNAFKSILTAARNKTKHTN